MFNLDMVTAILEISELRHCGGTTKREFEALAILAALTLLSTNI